MVVRKIPFCKSTLGDEEKRAICDVIDSGWVVMGKKTQEFEEEFARYVGAKHAVFVDSCTSALDLSLKFWKTMKTIHNVAVPSLTFTSTAEIVVNNNCHPIFVDVDRKTFCLQKIPDGVDLAISVNLTGNRAPIETLIVDSAHRIMRDDLLGSTNQLWCYSFYATKNMTTIQGGMIATNNEVAANWLRKARDHGVSKGTVERYKDGKWQYDVEFVGWREKSDDVHAAIGLEQLKKLDEMNENRQRVISRYNALLGLDRTGLHLFPVLVQKRAEFIEYLAKNGIQCSVHFLPLHKMTGYRTFRQSDKDLPNTNYLGDHLVSLPLYPDLSNEDIEYVVEKIKETNLLIHE